MTTTITVDTTLQQLVHELVVDPSHIMIQRAGELILMSDRYTIWNLAAFGTVLDDVGDPVSVLLDTLPPDGTYTWTRDGELTRWDTDILADVAFHWRRVTEDRDTPPQPIQWTGWSYSGVSIGLLGQQAIGAWPGWVERVQDRCPGYSITGYAPGQPLHVLNDQEPRQIIGVAAHRDIPYLGSLTPVLDVLINLPETR